MFIKFKFDNGVDILVNVSKHPADFEPEMVVDACQSFIDQMHPDTSYDEIVSHVMASFPDIVWNEVYTHTITV